MEQNMEQYFYLESPTRGYVNISFIRELNMNVQFGSRDPTFFKSKEKCEIFAKTLCYVVADTEVKSTDGFEDWYVRLLERYSL
ncbi:MAG: hypothetical protein M0R48_11215 [Candidatus Omnitrophica bacterium]|nr:hypothetical protein [Candidatus Omnitrophota bacterium]